MATNLIFYDSSLMDSALIMAEYYYKNYHAGDTLTVKNVNGVNTGTLTSYIAGLTDATYTEIVIACACESTADTTPTDTLNLANQYALLAKLVADSQGTLSDEYLAADTHTTTTIGKTGIWDVSEVVGTPNAPIYAVLTGGTGSGQLSTIKSNTADAATIYGVFYAEPDGTTNFKTLAGSKLFVVGQAQTLGTVTQNRSELGWTAMYPLITMPVINSYFAGLPGQYLFTGTADSFGAKTLVDSALGASTNLWQHYWVVVYDATTFGYQYGQIASNDATTLTLENNWTDGTPTGTPTFRIFAREKDCLRDIYLQMWIATNMMLVHTSSTHLANLTKAIDVNGALANGTAFKQTLQDYAYVDEICAVGKTYLDFIKGGHTVYVP
jgi:hypothetical protein